MKITGKKTILCGLLAIVVLLFAGGYAGYHEYASIRQAHLIKQTRIYLDRGNTKKALLCLQRALRYNPKDVQACRLMAELMESTHSPEAILWRSRLVELNPRSLDDRLAFVQAAIVRGDYATATNALNGVDEAGRNTAAYYNVAGTVAIAANQLAQAEAQFLEAVRLEPQNWAAQLKLAVVRLHTTNVLAQTDARETLRRLSSNPTNSLLRCEAMRELIVNDLRNKQMAEALVMSKNLLQQTNSTFKDNLLHLTVLRTFQSPEFNTALAATQSKAASEKAGVAEIYELGTWEMINTGSDDALIWLQSLPLAVQTNQTVAVLMSGCYTMRKDWAGLQRFLAHQNWGELEFLRLAFETAALRGQELDGAAKGEWEQALTAAREQKASLASLVMLLRLATQWHWQAETEDILWSIVNQHPSESWAVQALTQDLYLGGRTRSLMMLFSQEVQRHPADLSAKNNLAMTALLLDAQEHKPYDLAREVYQSAPTNSGYASTYAFSLHLQKKDLEALKIMQQLPPRDLDNPSIAGYYGVILKATGDKEKGNVYLQWASKAQTLPEEKKLFDQAKAGV